MKKLIIIAAVGMLSSLSASAASTVGQCVYPQTKPAKNGLQFKNPVYIYASPAESAEKVLLKSLDGFTVTKESNGFIQLKVTAGFGEENPDAGKILGWAKRSDFRLQELRNCN
jgi:hypothetical protein